MTDELKAEFLQYQKRKLQASGDDSKPEFQLNMRALREVENPSDAFQQFKMYHAALSIEGRVDELFSGMKYNYENARGGATYNMEYLQ